MVAVIAKLQLVAGKEAEFERADGNPKAQGHQLNARRTLAGRTAEVLNE